MFVALFLCVSAALLNAFRIDKHLSADGVHYFVGILDGADFFRIDTARRFAEYLTQWPLVMAVRSGLTHVPTLSAIFAFGLYLPYVLSFALCLYAVRGESPAVLALPLVSLAAVSLPADYLLVGEHHVMVLLASPILLLILRRTPPTRWDGVLLVLCLTVFTRSYPSALVPALLFAFLLAAKLIKDRAVREANAFRAVALLLCLATIVVAVLSILNPRDATNRDAFRQSLFMLLRQPEIFFLTAAALSLLLGLASRRRTWRGLWSILAAVSLALCAPYAIGPAHGLTAHQSFAARTLSVTLLPVLLLLTVVAHARQSTVGGVRKALLVGIVLTVVVGNLVHAAHWAQFRERMMGVLNARKGYVPVETTRFYGHPSRWAWTNPQLSVVWSFPVVRAIVENRKGEPWVPFDPRQTLVLKRYVQYDPVFAGVDQEARLAR